MTVEDIKMNDPGGFIVLVVSNKDYVYIKN